MGQLARSARGQMIDFELLAIKQQLASSPAPRAVEERKQAIAVKDGVRTDVIPTDDVVETAESTETIETGPIKTKRK